VESSRQKSTHSQTHIALFAQQTLQWHILPNLLYISGHLVNTKVGTFGFVQKETRFQPNQIVFFLSLFQGLSEISAGLRKKRNQRVFGL